MTIPAAGFRKQTNFTFECLSWTDDNTALENFEYKFTAVEEQTASVLDIQDWSLDYFANYVFDVRNFNVPETKVTVKCEIRDKFGAINTLTKDIRIINKPNEVEVTIKEMLVDYRSEPNFPLKLLFKQTELLDSVTKDYHKEILPTSIRTSIKPACAFLISG